MGRLLNIQSPYFDYVVLVLCVLVLFDVVGTLEELRTYNDVGSCTVRPLTSEFYFKLLYVFGALTGMILLLFLTVDW